MTGPHYLSSADVAHVIDLSPSALSNWKSRGKVDKLPPADATVGTRPLWRVETIRAWLDENHAATVARLETIVADGR